MRCMCSFSAVNLLMLVRVVGNNIVGLLRRVLKKKALRRVKMRQRVTMAVMVQKKKKIFDVHSYEIAFSLLIILCHSSTRTDWKEKDKIEKNEIRNPKAKRRKEKSEVRGFICWAFDLFAVRCAK